MFSHLAVLRRLHPFARNTFRMISRSRFRVAALVISLSEMGFSRSISGTSLLGLVGQQLRRQRFLVAHQDVTPDEILQLPDIAGPGVTLHQSQHLSRQRLCLNLEHLRVQREEVIDQHQEYLRFAGEVPAVQWLPR